MAEHHFDKSIKKEVAAAINADTFYTRAPFSVKEIQRYNNHSSEHLKLQRQDIDLSLTFADGRTVLVSEKFRQQDYNDLLLEIYSKYPETKGWIHKSNAERLAYFLPTRMFWIDKKSLCDFCLKELFPAIENGVIDRLLSQESQSLQVGLRINNSIYNCILTQAFNNTDGDEWNTISVSVPFTMLTNHAIRMQEYCL